MLPRIVLKENLNIEDFKIIHNETSNREIDPDLEIKAAQVWQDLLKEYETKGIHVWDGTYYRLDNVGEVAHGNRSLILSTIKFSTLNAYRKISEETEIKEEQYTNFISSGSIILTADNYFVFGKRGKNIHTTDVDILGGGLLESERIVNVAKDIENNTRKEMKEEGNIDNEDISSCRFIGILHTISMNILFIFFTQLNLNKEQLLHKFQSRKDDEMRDLVFVEKNKIEEYLMSLPHYRSLLWNLLPLRWQRKI